MRKAFKFLMLLLIVLLLVVGSFLLYTQLSLPDYKPSEVVFEGSPKTKLANDTISVLSWNIGYCGLGREMDFFYDGGGRMRTTKENTLANIDGIAKTLKENSDCQFMVLQEVDRHSKRSYHINQQVALGKALTGYAQFFAENYLVELVPMPLSNPMGRVNSGILTLSKLTPKEAIRYSYPDKHPWPTGLFMPKRCFLATRFPTTKGHDLVLINTHNSAYDNGSLRSKEMAQLKKFILDEYAKGSYVIVGGDWNQNPPGYEQKNEDPEAIKNFKPQAISVKYMPKGWKWAWDKSKDSNRFLNIPYQKGQTMTTTIDLFLVSPNVEVLNVNVLANDFAYSDHQPLRIKLVLR